MTTIRYPDKRQVGESYRDYANRMEGAARAAERDRDTLRAQLDAALDQQVAVLEIHRRTKLSPTCVGCAMPWPCPTARALGVTP